MRYFRWLFILVTACALLSGCASRQETPVPDQAGMLAVPPVLETAVAEGLSGAEGITPTGAAEAAPVDACLECHADKQQLIDTAKPVEEPVESESSGVG